MAGNKVKKMIEKKMIITARSSWINHLLLTYPLSTSDSQLNW